MAWESREVATAAGSFLVHEARGASGPPVLLFHDEIQTTPTGLADRLAEERTVLAPVLPGFWGADRPTWVQSIRDVADHLLSLTDELDLPADTALVGTSMGAWLAAELALRLPGQFASLSLLAPIGIRVKGSPAADFWYVRERDSILFGDVGQMPDVPVEQQVANEESAARYGWSPRLYDPTLAARLARLRMPTQLIWSADDGLLPREHLAAWQATIDVAETIEVAGGHYATHENPVAAADEVLRFVRAAQEEDAA